MEGPQAPHDSDCDVPLLLGLLPSVSETQPEGFVGQSGNKISLGTPP